MWRHTKAVQQAKADTEVKSALTNRVEDLRTKLEDSEQVNLAMQTNVTQLTQSLTTTSNSLVKTMADLAKSQQDAQAAAEAAKQELSKRDDRIAKLEGEKDQLDKKAADLQSAIAAMEKAINETEKKLAAAEGDREFLLKELKRLQSEKAELERQFNDLRVLRDQVAKLKDELSIARRVEWLRMGIYGTQVARGADKLLEAAAKTPGSKYNLKVELKQDGGARIVPSATTNSPATNAPVRPVPAPAK
jgi:chromosome segregation ATPase